MPIDIIISLFAYNELSTIFNVIFMLYFKENIYNYTILDIVYHKISNVST